jgi:pilus assembly protein CpaB
LGGLALVLGGLAASNVAGREAALSRRVGSLVDVAVARDSIAAGSTIRARALAIRRVPERFAPSSAFGSARQLIGQKAAVDIAAGSDVTAAMLGDGRARSVGPAIGTGERVAEVVALGSPSLITRGSRVDVLVTPEPRPSERGETVLALEDVEVLESTAAADEPAAGGDAAPGERVAVSLLVTLRQAVYLAAAQDFARSLRLLPRADGDRKRGHAGLAMGAQPP